MRKMPGFTAEGALFKGTQHYYGAAGANRSSGGVRPAFSPWLGRIRVGSEINAIESLICCWNCARYGGYCFPHPGGCLCLPKYVNGGGTPSPEG
jgi:hypothetical protein